ncbi:MAG: glycoside hydrolase family 18 protein [Terracidiphilus sp.]|jgi:chitinase
MRVCSGSYLLWLGILCCVPSLLARAAAKPVVVAYVFAKDSAIQPGEIAARKLTRINYAFANLVDGRVAMGYANDDKNLAMLVALKQQNPSLTVLVSAGGWLWSGRFTDIALTKESRAVFIASAVDFITRHQLDGLDIDWEFPALPGATYNYRPEDKQNYTLLLKELRQSFNRLEKKLGRPLYLTAAVGASQEFLDHTEMNKAQKYLDTVNLMAYDYYQGSSDPTTGHHAPLFSNPADPKKISADRSVREYEQAGVPPEKIVLGVPFYSHSWSEVPSTNNGLFQAGKPPVAEQSGSPQDLLKNGFIRYWDSVAFAPYLYNSERKVFVSYDDPQSLAAKCKYVLDHRLRGIMFWDYEADKTGALLDAVDAGLGIGAGAPGVTK